MKEKCEKRSPLQNLNGLPFHKRNSKNGSNLSSSANAVSGEHPKIRLNFSLSSNSSSSPSNSRFNLVKKSKTLSNLAKSEPNKPKVLSRSKENAVSRKPISQKREKNQSQSLPRREYGKNYRNPISISGRSSKLSSVRLKKGPHEFQAKMKNSRQNGSGKRSLELLGVSNSSNLNFPDNGTPVGRVDSLNFGSHDAVIRDSIYEGENGNCGSDAKTPPVEASLSPEINGHSHSKMLVVKSEATPVCYGAGHLISGVADNRKCRRRGSLRGGSEKVNLFDNERGDENTSSPIPLLAEGEVRWHLSPCKEGCEDSEIDYTNRLNQCRMVYDHDDSVGNVANKHRNRNVMLSPRKGAQIQGHLEPSRYDMVESLLVKSPSVSYSSSLSSGNNSKLSIGSLSSGNIIQTPDSETNVCVGRSRLDVHESSFVWPELDSTTESLEGVNLSRRDEMRDGSDLGFNLAEKVEKNVDSVSSWVSDSTMGNLSLSQMRISWHDGMLRCTSVETDEIDCCCILSDDDIGAGDRETCKGGIEIKENDSRVGNDLSPVLLDYEPCISTRGKKERDRTAAESICTDGGGLVASDDSDWTYFHDDGFK